MPRLSGSGPDLQSYGMADWPALLATAALVAETGTDPEDEEGERVDGAERSWNRVRPGLWPSVFPPTLAVQPYAAPLPREAFEVDESTKHRATIAAIYSTSAQAAGIR